MGGLLFELCFEPFALFLIRDVQWINGGVDPATRATVNSIAAQGDAVGQAAGVRSSD